MVHSRMAYLDYGLVLDRDMYIYENFARLEKGLCVPKSMATRVDSDDGPVLELHNLPAVPTSRCGECKMVAYAPERIVLEASAMEDCLLLFQDIFYPGWQASVDGRATPVLRTDVGIRALEFPAGRHTVLMEYRPRSLRVGFLVTCAGIVLALVYAFRARLRRHPANGQ
jgi:hypothetical protein